MNWRPTCWRVSVDEANTPEVENMCEFWSINSHYFHIIGDKLINPIVGVYIPIVRIPYQTSLKNDGSGFLFGGPAYFQGRPVMLNFQGVSFRKLTCKMGPVTSYKWDPVPPSVSFFFNTSETLCYERHL